MNCNHIDLNLLYEMRDSGRLNQDDQEFVLEMIQLLTEHKDLNRTQLLRIRDICLALIFGNDLYAAFFLSAGA